MVPGRRFLRGRFAVERPLLRTRWTTDRTWNPREGPDPAAMSLSRRVGLSHNVAAPDAERQLRSLLLYLAERCHLAYDLRVASCEGDETDVHAVRPHDSFDDDHGRERDGLLGDG